MECSKQGDKQHLLLPQNCTDNAEVQVLILNFIKSQCDPAQLTVFLWALTSSVTLSNQALWMLTSIIYPGTVNTYIHEFHLLNSSPGTSMSKNDPHFPNTPRRIKLPHLRSFKSVLPTEMYRKSQFLEAKEQNSKVKQAR